MARTPIFSRLRRALRLARLPETKVRERLSRREVLGMGALGLVGLACGAGLPRPARSRANVAVVGAGIAGLHCARLLARAGARVRVFEAANRVGGRMLTLRDRLPGGQVAELGGELVDSSHRTIHALARELELGLDDLRAGGGEESWFFGGRSLDEREVALALRPLAAKMAADVSAARDGEGATRLDEMSLAAWLDGAGASPLARSVIEAAYVGEYGRELDQQTVWNLLSIFDYETLDPLRIFGDSDERWHLHDGSDALTTALAQELGDRIVLGARLVALADRPDGSLRLSFDRDRGAREETCDHVVLAVPFTVLRDVDLRVSLLPDKRRVIRELGYGTNAKLVGAFSSRPWRAAGRSGSALTDAPIQCLWDASIGQPGESGALVDFLGGRAGMAAGDGTAEERMADALPSIETIFPGSRAAYATGSAVRMHWPSAPFAKGSYSCYGPGQASFRGIEGRREGNVHFCGEHTSVEFQGFMEGAAESGARAAREILG
jgi:monoamine oxidase